VTLKSEQVANLSHRRNLIVNTSDICPLAHKAPNSQIIMLHGSTFLWLNFIL